jgi:hypothetical protein
VAFGANPFEVPTPTTSDMVEGQEMLVGKGADKLDREERITRGLFVNLSHQ